GLRPLLCTNDDYPNHLRPNPMTPSTSQTSIERDPGTVEVVLYVGAHAGALNHALALEQPLEIRVRGRAVSRTIRTPRPYAQPPPRAPARRPGHLRARRCPPRRRPLHPPR